MAAYIAAVVVYEGHDAPPPTHQAHIEHTSAPLCDDVLAHIFMKIVHKRLFLVCKRWNKIMRELPADTLMTHYLAPLLASAMPRKVKKIPACYYPLMSFAQQVSIPNLLVINTDHMTPILEGYRYCIPWGIVIGRLSSDGYSLSHIQALKGCRVCPYKYIIDMFYHYEQYRRHVLITHRAPPIISVYARTFHISWEVYRAVDMVLLREFTECVDNCPDLFADVFNELARIISRAQVVDILRW